MQCFIKVEFSLKAKAEFFMPFKVIAGSSKQSGKIGNTLTCNEQRSSSQVCATECFDREKNGTGCPGFYMDPIVGDNCHICHVSILSEIQSALHTSFSGHHILHLLNGNTLVPDVAMDFEQFSAGSNVVNGTNTIGTTTNIRATDHVPSIKGMGFHIHNGGKVYLTGSEQKCWTNLEHCQSGVSISIWMKATSFNHNYLVGTGAIFQRGITLFLSSNKVRTLVTLDNSRYPAQCITNLIPDEWYLVSGSYHPTDGVSIYLNGIFENENRFEHYTNYSTSQVNWGASIGVRDAEPYNKFFPRWVCG